MVSPFCPNSFGRSSLSPHETVNPQRETQPSKGVRAPKKKKGGVPLILFVGSSVPSLSSALDFKTGSEDAAKSVPHYDLMLYINPKMRN
jgi:hypothetical protein